MVYNIVTNYSLVNELKKSKYFKINLGLASTMIKNGDRILNDKDKFALYYNNQYRTTIYAQGNIGDIKIYNDVFIKEPLIAVYIGHDFEEFVLTIDFNIIKEKGIDFYLGHILKTIEEENEKRVKTKQEEKINVSKKQGNSDAITKTPGMVTYDDIKEYLKKQNEQRYKIN
jgi:hypothetical protein